MCKGQVTNYGEGRGEGGYQTGGGGGAHEVLPLRKVRGGSGGGGYNNFWGSFYVIA